MVELLVADAHLRGVTALSLDTTAMGKPLYGTCSFLSISMEGELPFSS